MLPYLESPDSVWHLLQTLTEKESRSFADMVRVIAASRLPESKLQAANEMAAILHGAADRATHANTLARSALERELARASYQD